MLATSEVFHWRRIFLLRQAVAHHRIDPQCEGLTRINDGARGASHTTRGCVVYRTLKASKMKRQSGYDLGDFSTAFRMGNLEQMFMIA